MSSHGKFIVVEGLEGAGKSTAMHTIETVLSEHLSQPILTREPGGTKVGEAVRTLIKTHDIEMGLDDRAELLLLYAARVQLVEEVIKPALLRGQWVVSDRFEWSTFAYQGGGRHIPKTLIEQISHFALQGFKPDLTFYLDIRPELGLERVKRRGEADRIESESLTFFSDIYAEYHALMNQHATVAVIDASQPIETVQKKIKDHLIHYLKHHAN